jgi:ribonuclease HI
MKYSIYTDGACSGNPGPGGWGVVVIDDTNYPIYEINGNEKDTTNNRMELQGFLAALTWCCAKTDQNDAIKIYTDSAYIFNCFHDKWYTKWQTNGWVNASKQPIANKELWQSILQQYNLVKNEITICKVAGHSGNEWNEYVDKLAVQARKELK